MTNISALCDVTMLSSVRRNISRISESSGFLSSYQFVLSSPVELRYGLTSFSTLASRPIMKGITTRVASAYGRYATTAATSALVACCFYNGFSTAHAQSAAQPPSSYASSEATTSTVHAAPSPVDKGPYDDVDEKALERSGPKYEDPRVKGLTVVVAANIEDVCYDPTADVIIKLYSPNCQLCKYLEPIWEQIAYGFIPVKTMKVANMNADVRQTKYNHFGIISYILRNEWAYTIFNSAQENFKAGFLRKDEMGKTPTIKIYPALSASTAGGSQKQLDTSNIDSLTKNKPDDDTTEYPNACWDNRWKSPMTSIEAMINFAYDNATHKFDKKMVLDRINSKNEETKDRLLRIFAQDRPLGSDIRHAGPCGKEIRALETQFFLSKVIGLGSSEQLFECFDKKEDCLQKALPEAKEYWKKALKDAQFSLDELESIEKENVQGKK